MYTYVRIKSWGAGEKPVDTCCGLLMQEVHNKRTREANLQWIMDRRNMVNL